MGSTDGYLYYTVAKSSSTNIVIVFIADRMLSLHISHLFLTQEVMIKNVVELFVVVIFFNLLQAEKLVNENIGWRNFEMDSFQLWRRICWLLVE